MNADQRLDSTPAKIPRRRRGVPKSRTGCSICRARHIKCDEAVPKCKNCVVAGWKCEYPTTTTTTTTNTPPASQRLVFINHFYRHQHVSHHVSIRAAPHDLPDSSPSERRALAYFQHRAAAELGGVCLPDLWSKYILSTSRSNDVVRHAIIALVVFHEDDVVEPFGASSRSKYALQHYSKGVNGLLQLKHDPDSNAVDITLMCCIIFGTIEMLRGNLQSALVHLHSGKSILIEEGTRLETDAASHLPRRLVDDILQRVESQILGLMDAGTFDLPLAVRPAKPVVPDVFESVQDAFYLLETLHNQILHFFSHVGRFLARQNDHPNAFNHLSHELREFETLFHKWQTSFDHLTLRRQSNNDDPIDPLAILLLNILRTGVKTMFPVHRSCHMRQTDFDAYTPDFANIVTWCETYITSTSTRRPPSPDIDAHLGAQPSALGPRPIAPKPGTPFYTSTFSMSTGVVATLFLCGVRCRDPVIRRKASDLLQYGIRKEGLWHSRLCSTIVDVCIRCEEDNALREMGRGVGVGNEAGVGMGVEVGVEVGTEAGTEVGMEVGTEAGTEVGMELGTEVGMEVGTEVGTEMGTEMETEAGNKVGGGAGVRVGSSVRALVADGVITDASQISENARVVVDGFRLVGERRGEVSIRAKVPDGNGKTGLRSVVMVDQVWW